MRSCCVFDSARLSLPLLAVYFPSHHLIHLLSLQLLLPRCGGQIPCVLPLMRTTSAPLPSTTFSQVMSPTTTTSRRPIEPYILESSGETGFLNSHDAASCRRAFHSHDGDLSSSQSFSVGNVRLRRLASDEFGSLV